MECNKHSRNSGSQENPPFLPEIYETLKVNPTDIAESSNIFECSTAITMQQLSGLKPTAESKTSVQNSNYRFLLQVNNADKINFALGELSLSSFNPDGLGRIDVDHEYFEITAMKDEVICCFRPNVAGMIKFECLNPVKIKIVKLSEIFGFLANADKDDIITVSLLDGSSHLSFMLGELSLSSFNPDGLGSLDVDHEYFEITAMKDDVICCFRLNVAGMIKFECLNPVKIKIGKLSEIFGFLASADKDDIITVSLLDGSSHLSFMLGLGNWRDAKRPRLDIGDENHRYFILHIYDSLSGVESHTQVSRSVLQSMNQFHFQLEICRIVHELLHITFFTSPWNPFMPFASYDLAFYEGNQALYITDGEWAQFRLRLTHVEAIRS